MSAEVELVPQIKVRLPDDLNVPLKSFSNFGVVIFISRARERSNSASNFKLSGEVQLIWAADFSLLHVTAVPVVLLHVRFMVLDPVMECSMVRSPSGDVMIFDFSMAPLI